MGTRTVKQMEQWYNGTEEQMDGGAQGCARGGELHGREGAT